MTSATDGRSESDASLAIAAQSVLEAGERMALDWLELIRLEWADRANSLAHGLEVTAIGLVILVMAWILASAALVTALGRWLPLDASLSAAALGEAGLGSLLLWLGRRSRGTA